NPPDTGPADKSQKTKNPGALGPPGLWCSKNESTAHGEPMILFCKSTELRTVASCRPLHGAKLFCQKRITQKSPYMERRTIQRKSTLSTEKYSDGASDWKSEPAPAIFALCAFAEWRPLPRTRRD